MRAGEVVGGRFAIERLAGAGGMGAVFRARDLQAGSAVALKVLNNRGSVEPERFVAEAEILARLEHPGIVRYVAHGTTADGEPFLAMEWLEGEDLAARLQRGRLGVRGGITVIRRAAEALAAVHARGLFHRDIKPSNLFLVGADLERVKVIDFGIARSSAPSRRLTGSGVILGTLGYLSPEQARGSRELDARTDVFALGAVLFECLSGQQAFPGEHVMAVLAKLLLEEVPPLRALRPEVPGSLEWLVARMLSKSPDERPADGGAVAAELAAVTLDGERGGAEEAPRPEARLRSEQRLGCMIAIGAEDLTSDPEAPTLPLERVFRAPRERAEAMAAPFGARVEALADGSLLVLLPDVGSATDQAARAARCALGLRSGASGADGAGDGTLAGSVAALRPGPRPRREAARREDTRAAPR